MKILVTGGCGFIGSHLVDALVKADHEVVVIDDLSTGSKNNLNCKAKFINGDITTPGIFDPVIADAEFCFHLAAIASVERSRINWLETHRVNAGGTVALFDAIARSGRKTPVVFASSAAVYGSAQNMPLRENAQAAPVTAYGADKLAGEHAGYTASTIHGIPNIGLRFFNVYGPRQDPSSPYSGVISIFYNQISKGERVTIYGSGEQSRDFVYVSDVIDALMKSMQKILVNEIKYDIFNVCTGHPVTVNELVSFIGRKLSEEPKMNYTASRRGDIRVSVGSPEKAFQELNFKARNSLSEGLGNLF